MSRLLRLGAATLILATAMLATAAPPVAAADDVTMTLTAQPYAIAPGAGWTASFDVVGDLGTAARATPPPTTVTPTVTTPSTTPARPVVQARVQAHRAVEDRGELRAALDGERSPTVSRFSVPVVLLGTADAATFTLEVPTTSDPDTSGALLLARAGVYPVTVDLIIDGDVVATHRTFVERLPTASPADEEPLQIAVAASVADPGPEAGTAAVDHARDGIEAIATSTAALGGVMSVAFPPAIVADLDDADLGSLRAALAGAEVLAVPALALDPSSAVAAGQSETFSAALRDGEDLLGAALPQTPPQRSAWLVTTPLSARGAAMLRDPLGYDVLVVDQAVYDGLEGNIGGYHDQTLAFGVDLGDGVTLPGLVVHPASRWLDPAALTAADMGAVDGAIAILADLRVTRGDLGADRRLSAVLQLAPGATPDPGVLTALAELVATTPDTALTTLAALATTDVLHLPDGVPETVRLPANAGTDLAERVNRIALTRVNAAGAASMLLDHAQAADWDAELDRLVSTAFDEATVDARLAAIGDEAAAIYACVQMPEPTTFTLTGRSQTMRLNLTNRCPQDLRVVVHPTSSRLTFPDGDFARTLAANAVTEVTIEVQSRSNGTSALGVELLTPVGSLTLPQKLVLTARVNALSGLGQLVTGGALLVLLSWWYGHFRKRRRLRRAMLGEVDNPIHVEAVSPDAAEVAAVEAPTADAPAPSDSVTEP